VLGGVSIAILMIWETGLDPFKFWQRATAPKPAPIAKAPEHPSNKAIGPAPVTPRGNDSSISPDPLALTLVRVHLGRNAFEGSAELGVVRESPQTYQAGALLENGAKLAEIHSDYVLLKKGNLQARLYIEAARATGKVGDLTMLTVGGPVERPPPAKATSREILTDYIRPSPVYDGDTLLGYQIYPGAKSGPFAQMGLKSGDLITDIDGAPLSNPALAWEAFHQLAEGSAMSATIKRNGVEQSVSLDGALIVNAEQSRSDQTTQAMLVSPVH